MYRGAGARALLAALILAAGCAPLTGPQAPGPRVEAPQISGGSHWVYRKVNPFNGETIGTLTEHAGGDSLGQLPFPLEAGRQWSERLVIPQDFGPSRVQWIWGQTLGWENIRTPAGAWLALKVVRETAFGDGDSEWTQTRRVETLWYVPEVAHWVRLERRDERYLRAGRRSRTLQFDRILWELEAYRPG